MTELSQILDAVENALSTAGIPCVRAFPAEALDTETGLVSLAVKNCARVPGAFAQYLGLGYDEFDNEVELYGQRLELSLALDIWSPPALGAQECSRVFLALSDALRCLPAGLQIRKLSAGSAALHRASGLLLCPVSLDGRALLIARSDPASGQFLDFVLKGWSVHV